MQPKNIVSRPRRHPYPTFKSQLPLLQGFSFMLLDPKHLSWQTPRASKERRLDFVCAFCSRIKSFTTIIGYWSHLFHKHQDYEEEAWLKEILRTSILLRSYWSQYKERSKHGQQTLAKFDQVDREDFGWDVAESWELRC